MNLMHRVKQLFSADKRTLLLTLPDLSPDASPATPHVRCNDAPPRRPAHLPIKQIRRGTMPSADCLCGRGYAHDRVMTARADVFTS